MSTEDKVKKLLEEIKHSVSTDKLEFDKICEAAVQTVFEKMAEHHGVGLNRVVYFSPSEMSIIANTIFVNLVAHTYVRSEIKLDFAQLMGMFVETLHLTAAKTVMDERANPMRND